MILRLALLAALCTPGTYAFAADSTEPTPLTLASIGAGTQVGGVGFALERRFRPAWVARGAIGAFALDGGSLLSLGGGASLLSGPRSAHHAEVGGVVGALLAEDGPFLGMASFFGYRHLRPGGGFLLRVGGGPAVLLVSAAGVPQGHVFLPELEVGWAF